MFTITVSDHTAGIVHWYLLGGDVLATIAVGVGILWEAESLIVRHEMARRFVFWGIVLETLCSVGLFAFDEGISGAQQSTIRDQQSKIIELDTRLAARRIDPLQSLSIGQDLSQYAPQIFRITTYPDCGECTDLANELGRSLQTGAGWNWTSARTMMLGVAYGVIVEASSKPALSREAAERLMETLNREHILSSLKLLPDVEPNVVDIQIGIKP